MLQLMLAFLLSVVPTHYRFPWKFRGIGTILRQKDILLLQKHYIASEIGRHWCAGLTTTVAYYNVWFWFDFVAPSSYKVYIFLFTKVSPQPVSQEVYRVFGVAYMLIRGLMYLFNLFDILSIPQFKFQTWKRRWPNVKTCARRVVAFYLSRSKGGDRRNSYFRERIHEHQ